MTYVSQEARKDLLDRIAEAIDELGIALAAIGDAYERLDDRTADRLEEGIFRPLQLAYGRLQRTHTGFGARHGFPAATFSQPGPMVVHDVRDPLERAVEHSQEANAILVDMQDSMMPVEVGDAELRAGLADARGAIEDLPERIRALIGRVGR